MHNKLADLEIRLSDFKEKYSDKCKECESYIQISEHRLAQYNELMTKKRELES